MSEAEKILADFQNQSATTTAGSEKQKGRERAAKEWVNHFFSISQYIKEFKENGVVIDTVDSLEKAVVAHWEATQKDKDAGLNDLLSKF